MKSTHRIWMTALLGALLAAGAAEANSVWSNFNDPFPTWSGRYDPGTRRTYPIRWIGTENQDAIWREGQGNGSATVVNGQVRLKGNGTGISGGVIRYDDVCGPNPDVSLEFTIPDFAAVRAMPVDEFPGLFVGIFTGSFSIFCIRREAGPPAEVWRIVAYYVYDPNSAILGEIVPLTETTPARVSLRMVRTGNTVNLYTAYDEDATRETPEGFYQEGNFHEALSGYNLSTSEQEYISLRVIYSPSIKRTTPTPLDNTYAEVYIDDIMLSGPHVPKIVEAANPYTNPQLFAGPDWPAMMLESNRPGGGGWYEEGDRFETGVTLLSSIYPPEYQWLFSETPGGPAEEIAGATDSEYVDDFLSLEDSGWYSCRVADSGAKTELLTDPIEVLVLPAGSLPAMGIAALCITALLCALMGVVVFRRRLAA